MNLRIGQGYDIHRLEEGYKLFLGGIEIPFELGLKGHSDADVLIHAIIDAMLGSIALQDIGRHFPPSDDAYKGIDSKELLCKTSELLAQNNYKICNIDSTIIAQKPKLSNYIDQMRECLASILSLDVQQVSIKAKTAEGLGSVGESLAMEAHAVILIEKI